jgi:low affinity Fe/Cu permease
MTKYVFISLSLMWMTVFYQNCSPNAQAMQAKIAAEKNNSQK